MPATPSPLSILDRYCDAFVRRAPEEIAELFAADAVFDLPLHTGRIQGRENIAREIRAALTGLKNIRIAIQLAIEGEGGLFAEGFFESEQVGIAPRVDGTPSRLDFKFVIAMEVHSGRIARWSEYFDTRPLKPRERARLYPITRRSPYWNGTEQAGVSEFMVYNHVYFPLVYQHSAAEEYIALTERVTMWDVACERQTELRGPDALKFAQYLTTRDLSAVKAGDCKYTLVCDPEGLILCDPVLLNPWEDVVWLSHGDVDLTLWARGAALHAGFEVEVREPDVAPIQVQGPRAADVLRGLVEAPIDALGSYKCTVTRVAGVPAVVSRTGWSGGAGFEVFPLQSSRAAHLWDQLAAAGRPCGIMITGPNINRAVEKGVTDTAYYSNSGMNPYEAGHGRLVDLEKGSFIGREALRAIALEGPKRKTVGVFIDGDIPLLEWYWPITDQRGGSGEIRWATYSFALNRSIGIALVDAAVESGESVQIHHPSGSSAAIVTQLPFV